MKVPLLVFIKGICMGIADLIPGISGGTIALLTGIYQRLITGITQAIDISHLKQKGLAAHIKAIDWNLFIPLILGILTAIFAGSRVIAWLLDNAQNYTMAFIIGLIATATVSSYLKLPRLRAPYLFVSILCILATALFFLSVSIALPTVVPFFFLSGLAAGAIMILPGVSGSFVLLLLGHYQVVLQAASDPFNNLHILIPVAIGVLLGIAVSAFTLQRLLKKHSLLGHVILFSLVLGSIPSLVTYISGPHMNIGVLVMLAIGGATAVLLEVVAQKYQYKR